MVEIPESAKHHFDHILPPGQDWFTPQELAKILGRSDQYIRNALEQGVILNHTFQIGKRRRHYQVPRSAVILYILETASYQPEDFLSHIEQLLESPHPRNSKQF